MGRFAILWVVAALSVMAVVDTARAEKAVLTGEAAFRDAGGDVVLRLPLSRPVPWRVWLASEPPRLVIEVREVDWEAVPVIASPSVSEVHAEATGPDASRLVAHLREPLAVDRAEMATNPDGQAVLQVTLVPTTGMAFHDMAKPLEFSDGLVPKTRPVIVIDPGHGGRDPGAGAGSVNEAVLMLEMANLLKDDLVATGLFDVVLTRTEDAFVPLETRLTRARAADADAFLSLHADRLPKDAGHASGVTVYTLANHLAGAAADRQTARHDADDILKGVDLSGAGDAVALALIALKRQDTDPRTASLSSTLIGAFEAAGLAVNGRPERQGDFAVLKAADIPSALIELGFLSSDADLARLSSEKWRAEASRAMRDALLQWIQEDRVLRDALRQ